MRDSGRGILSGQPLFARSIHCRRGARGTVPGPLEPVFSSQLASLRRSAAIAAIVLIALVLRLWGITWGLSNATVSTRPHPDEWTVYYLFQWFNSYRSLSPCPVAGHHCFFDWGTTFPYLSNVFHLITYPAVAALPAGKFGAGADMEFVRSVLSARLFSALMSTATVYVVYRIALRGYGSRAALLAALCAALSCLLVQLGHFGTPDATTGFLLSVTLLSALWAADNPSPTSFALAGLFCGIATGSEYHMALLFVPVVAAWSLVRERSFVWLSVAAGAALA